MQREHQSEFGNLAPDQLRPFSAGRAGSQVIIHPNLFFIVKPAEAILFRKILVEPSAPMLCCH